VPVVLIPTTGSPAFLMLGRDILYSRFPLVEVIPVGSFRNRRNIMSSREIDRLYREVLIGSLVRALRVNLTPVKGRIAAGSPITHRMLAYLKENKLRPTNTVLRTILRVIYVLKYQVPTPISERSKSGTRSPIVSESPKLRRHKFHNQ
jgi:hypothetical protein